jgi:hypothetical protein
MPRHVLIYPPFTKALCISHIIQLTQGLFYIKMSIFEISSPCYTAFKNQLTFFETGDIIALKNEYMRGDSMGYGPNELRR